MFFSVLPPEIFCSWENLKIYCRYKIPLMVSNQLRSPTNNWLDFQKIIVEAKVISLPTVDGRNPANQLRLVVHPIVYRVFYISGGAAFLPSTVVSPFLDIFQGQKTFVFESVQGSQWIYVSLQELKKLKLMIW